MNRNLNKEYKNISQYNNMQNKQKINSKIKILIINNKKIYKN